MPRAAIFDIDGTLVDSVDLHASAWQAAAKAGIPTIGVLCGGFTEGELWKAGCVAVYPGPAALLACFGASPLAASLP